MVGAVVVLWHNRRSSVGTGGNANLGWERARLAAARRGDREALADLYRAFAPRLYSQVLMPKLGNRQAAEDALSETFRTFIERIHDVESDDRSIFQWLARVAGNKATDMHRVKARTHRALTNFEGLVAPLREHGNPEGAVEDDDIRGQLKKHVARVLEGLNPRYRRAVELRFLQEKSREECASVMEVNVGTFDVLLLRALRAFHRDWHAVVGAEGIER